MVNSIEGLLKVHEYSTREHFVIKFISNTFGNAQECMIGRILFTKTELEFVNCVILKKEGLNPVVHYSFKDFTNV